MWKQNMTVLLSINLSTVLDMSTQDALQLFVENRDFSHLPKGGICCLTLQIISFVGISFFDIFHLIRVFMKGDSTTQSTKINKIFPENLRIALFLPKLF